VRVLHVITGLGTGGAETQLAELIAHCRHDAEVVGIYDFGETGRQLRARRVPAHDLDSPRNYDLRTLPRLARMIRRGSYDAVHTHLYRATVYGRIAARLAGTPIVVTTEHSLGASEIEGRPLNARIRALYMATERFSDRTIAVSEWVRDLLVDWGVPAEKVVVIPNGIDVERFRFDPEARASRRRELRIPSDAAVIGTVGRLIAGRRYGLLIESAASIIRDGAWLVVVGEGPELPSLRSLAARLGISERVIFTGVRGDVPALLSAMDLFTSPVVEETFGIAPVEAIAAGLPAVVTHCPALEGLGRPRVWWTNAGPEGLAPAVAGALASAGERRELPPELRERYDIRRTAARIDSLYDALRRGSVEIERR
jgi:glycosyltransferase involved in cell wall biosynthesis